MYVQCKELTQFCVVVLDLVVGALVWSRQIHSCLEAVRLLQLCFPQAIGSMLLPFCSRLDLKHNLQPGNLNLVSVCSCSLW